jgi:hypothetical protein
MSLLKETSNLSLAFMTHYMNTEIKELHKVFCILFNTVTYRSIARQRLDKYIPAETDYW